MCNIAFDICVLDIDNQPSIVGITVHVTGEPIVVTVSVCTDKARSIAASLLLAARDADQTTAVPRPALVKH